MNLSKLLKPLSILTAVLTAIVYIDILFFFGAFFITIPLTTLVATITIIFASIKKEYLFVLINLGLAVIAIISFFIFPW